MSKLAWSIDSVGCRLISSTGAPLRCATGSSMVAVMYVVRKPTMMSQPASRSRSAATAPSWASETNPTSTTSQPSSRIRSETRSDDRRSCGSRSGNCGQ
ncbi:hypothetical protein [Streptosporangium vulgare]|uniref:hypothetical protein n=1 Tax=Streptosporangium vulgare TaxID=46190 RepID=UPI0031D00FC5